METEKKYKTFVYVLDKDKKPLMNCSGKRARLLLERGRAKVIHINPFVIQIIDIAKADCAIQKEDNNEF